MKSLLILALSCLLAAGCRSGCEIVKLDKESSHVTAEIVRQNDGVSIREGNEVGCVGVSGETFVLERDCRSIVGTPQVVTVCAVVVANKQRKLVPLAVADIVPSRTTSVLNLRTANVRDEDGDLIVREFRENPVRYAETHRLIAVAGTVTDGEGLVPKSERTMVFQHSIIEE